MYFKNLKSKKKNKQTNQKNIQIRKKNQRIAAPFLREWEKKAEKDTCVVCGDIFQWSLGPHHLYGGHKGPTVTMCGSCHKVFDKHKGISELRIRRRKFLGFNKRN